MAHVITVVEPPFSAAGLVIRAVPSATDNLIWLATCEKTGITAVVDGPGAGEVLDVLAADGLTLDRVLNTHTHGDHIGINRDLLARGLLPGVVIGPRAVAEQVPGITHPVDEGDTVQIGAVTGRVLRTEGHLRGHISYVFGEDTDAPVLFCGDTLFAGGCGYLFDGPPAAMFDSLMRLSALPGGTLVCCAHEYTIDNLKFAWSVESDNAALVARIGAARALRAEGRATVPSTIAEERATNPFLRPGSPTIRAKVGAAMPDADLSSFVGVFTATRALKDTKAFRAIPDDQWP
jgi:hydroxyacylglutathione hydrolase